MIRLRIQQFIALTGLTALETLRQPVCLVLTLTSLAFIGILPAILTHTLGDSARLVRDSALALHFVCGLILGCYAACATLSREMRRGTAAAILAKPVGREVFFLAKYAGIALVMIIFSLLMTMATVLSTRTVSEAYSLDLWSLAALLLPVAASMAISGGINYLTHKPFVSVAFLTLVVTLAASFIAIGFLDNQGALVPFGSTFTLSLIPVSGLIAMAVLVLAGFAVAVATQFDVVPTLMVSSVILMVGMMTDYLFGRAADTSTLAGFLYHVLPNWQHFWAADALNQDDPFPVAYLWDAGCYAACYLAGMLCLGLVCFRHLEVRT
jgi:ABC-type transport system involved in multi-copper enzyme maturation permease subunit